LITLCLRAFGRAVYQVVFTLRQCAVYVIFAHNRVLAMNLRQTSGDVAQNVYFRRFTPFERLFRPRACVQAGETPEPPGAIGQPTDPNLVTEDMRVAPSLDDRRSGGSSLSQRLTTTLFTSSRLRDRVRSAPGRNRIGASLFEPSLRMPEPLVEGGIVYKVANNHHERASAFQLVHNAYIDAGLMRTNALQMRVMPHHLLATTAVFVALDNDRVIATITLVGDGRLGLPMESVYAQEVSDLRRPSCWVGEVSALASAPAATGIAGLDVVVGLMRLMAQFSRRHGLEHLLVAVHPRHARFYRRCLGFKTLGGEKPYPSVCNRPAVALHLDLSRLEEDPPATYDLFFGESIAEEHLRFCPISAPERRYFSSAIDYEAPSHVVLACA
jgi:hypothetical protein